MTAEAADLDRAHADLAAYRRAMELLRPWMEGTDRTVAEAVALMREAGLDPREVVIVFGSIAEASA